MKNRVRQVYDEWLVLSYKSGNRKALGLLVKRWNHKLIRHIYYRTGDKEVSKDLAQDCWVAILNGLFRLNDPAEFGVWALRIANNKAVDWVRKQSRERKMLKEEKIILEEEGKMDLFDMEKEDQLAKIKKAYDQIEKKYRLLLNLHYRQNCSVKQMSKILIISEGTVKSRLFTARKKLKEEIKKNNHG